MSLRCGLATRPTSPWPSSPTDFWRTTHLVVTNGVSDWSQQPAPPPDADGWYDIRAVRERDSVQILCGDQAGEVSSGPMCAAPKGPGFTAAS
jgi:regulation of enolase protein 1 (concanavalin A-like superfamily)